MGIKHYVSKNCFKCFWCYTPTVFSQDLVSFVHRKVAIVEQQSKIMEEQSATIQGQSALIQQLKEETGVRLFCLLSNTI